MEGTRTGPPLRLSRAAFLAVVALTALVTYLTTTALQSTSKPGASLRGAQHLSDSQKLRELQSVRTKSKSTGFYVHPDDGIYLAKAKKAGTDKVNFHATYQGYFELQAGRTRVNKMLEIGLGCDMNYGPGRSAAMWRDYMPHAEIWFGEYDAACVDKHRSRLDALNVRAVTGDQGDAKTVFGWLSTTGGVFDFIIDDGGHTNHQIYTSFMILFQHALKPGGLYVIEDLSVSRILPWQNGDQNSKVVMVDVLRDWVEALLTFPTQHMAQKPGIESKIKYKMPPGIKSIDCSMVACAIVKCYADDPQCGYGAYVDQGLVNFGKA